MPESTATPLRPATASGGVTRVPPGSVRDLSGIEPWFLRRALTRDKALSTLSLVRAVDKTTFVAFLPVPSPVAPPLRPSSSLDGSRSIKSPRLVPVVALTSAADARPLRFKSREISHVAECKLDGSDATCVHLVAEPAVHHFVAETKAEAVYAWAVAAGIISTQITFDPFEAAATVPETPLVRGRGSVSNSSRHVGLEVEGGSTRGTPCRTVAAGEPEASAEGPRRLNLIPKR